MTGVYTDPRFADFTSPSKQRKQAYREHKAEIEAEYKKEIDLAKSIQESAKARKQELIEKEHYSSHEANKIIRPMLIQAREKKEGAKNIRTSALEKNHVLIYPFKLFYKAEVYHDNGLLKPRFRILLADLIILAIALLSLLFMDIPHAQFIGENFGYILSRMFVPDENMVLNTWPRWFDFMWETAVPAIWKTFQMMFIATAVGSILAIPFMILCSENIIENKAVTGFFRVLLNILRTFPTMVLAIIGVAFFGIGTKAGIFAMILFTLGIMIKIMYERIETVDMHPYEAATSTGGSKPKAFVVAIAPQILPDYLSNVIYTFEINIRASVILGFVNAGGIGKLIQEAMNNYEYNQIGAILIPLLVLVWLLTFLSSLAKRITQ